MSVTVIIVTLNRPDCVRRCLECLEQQEPQPDQVVVVDASDDDATRNVVSTFSNVFYRRNENGYGRMTASRNIGLLCATGEIIAFIDDDAFAHRGWLAALLEPYHDVTVGAVGGRALNNQPGEHKLGVDRIGRLLPNGEVTGNFAADPGKLVEVDHIIGCNMSFRRSVLAELGGLREDYPGTEVREETDISLRIRKLGYSVLYTPFAIVDHIGAPQAKGRRFDTRYAYYVARNHAVMLIRNFGPFAGITMRYFVFSAGAAAKEFARRLGGALARVIAFALGTFFGIVSGLDLFIKKGREPRRLDAQGDRIRLRSAN